MTAFTIMSTQRAESIAAADRAAPLSWKDAARTEVEHLIDRGAPFTTDAVWSALDAAGIIAPPEPRALGAIIVAARNAGRIVASGFAPSPRRGGIATVWQARSAAPTSAVAASPPDGEAGRLDALVAADKLHVLRLLRCEAKDLDAAVARGTPASVRMRAAKLVALAQALARAAK